MKDKFIVVSNWERFQHYKDRNPPWIKNYTDLMNNDDYRSLSGHRRGVLHGLWLEYASSQCRLRVDSLSLTRRLGVRVTTADLKALNEAGFITFAASNVLAERYQDASPETEREKTPPKPPPTPPTDPPDLDADRKAAFDAYLGHGGNLNSQKRGALAANYDRARKKGVAHKTLLAVAAQLGRENGWTGDLASKAAALEAAGGACENEGSQLDKLPLWRLRLCSCPLCRQWVAHHEAMAAA